MLVLQSQWSKVRSTSTVTKNGLWSKDFDFQTINLSVSYTKPYSINKSALTQRH